jgi:hypothetical protein
LSYNFLPYEQDQLFLMPPALSDWVKEGSLARFVSDLVDGLDADGELAAFYASYRSDGWGLRGVAKVGTEWSLFCTTNNILKLWRAQGPELKPAVT